MAKAAIIPPESAAAAAPEGIAMWLPFALLLLDGDDRVTFANPAAERFFRQSSHFLQRRSLQQVAGPALPALAALVRTRGAAALERELAFEDHQGQTSVADVEIVPIDENPGALLVVIHGNAQEQGAAGLDRQAPLAGLPPSIGAMAAVLAHEVKNPLSGIRGAAQLIAQNADADDRQLTSLICDETERIRALVDRLEAFGDPRPAELGPVNIHEVLDHVMEVAVAGFASHVTFERIYDPSLPPVRGERDRLIQILLNLIKNAAEAVPRNGGRIELATGYRHGTRVSLTGEQTAGSAPVTLETPLEISVTDNGPGIDPAIRAHLFDPFVTTKAGGTGLGLAMVQKYAADFDARIKCDSSEQGSRFSLLFPVWKEKRKGENP
jgi:two-component system nitrogen regulation sensor histidine kinase GlnL